MHSSLVIAWLHEAAQTLKALPRGVARAKLSSWPDVVRSVYEAYGYDTVTLRASPPSAAAISRLDNILAALLRLDAAERRLLWARACDIPWRRLEDMDGRSSVTLRKYYKNALVKMGRLLTSS